MPRVTIVTTCWNSEAYLARTMDSVRAQSLTDWEHVVVDDGSPGDFMGVARPYCDRDPRIQIVRQSNGGLCNARNAGYMAASVVSEYLLFLDADDIMEPAMLATLVAELDQHPEAGMAFCDRTIIDGDDRPIEAFKDDWIPRIVPRRLGGRRLADDEAETPFVSFYTYNIVVPSLTLIRRAIFDRVGPWDESLGPIYDDADMWLRISLQSTARYVPQRLLRRRIHGDQLTRSPEGDARRRKAWHVYEAKWNRLAWLGPADQRRVVSARRIKEGRLTPYLWFSWARERARRHEWVEAARCLGRGLKELSLHAPRALIVSAD